MVPVPYRIVQRRREIDDVVTLGLRPTNGEGLNVGAPGQFNMLYVFGVGEVPISISGDTRTTDVLVHTTRAAGAVTSAICELQPGDTLGVRGPFGSPWPIDALRGKDVIFVAGGIGLAPLRPAIYHVLAAPNDHGRVTIAVGARQSDQLLFTDEYDAWRAAGADVPVTVDAGGIGWSGSIGVVTELLPRAHFDPRNAVALVCGPEIMMRFTVQRLLDLGLSADDVHITMERNMKCAVGLCGHCQYGADFVCKDGPVFPYSTVADRFRVAEV